MQVYTANDIENFQPYSHVNNDVNIIKNNYNKHYFQILIFEENNSSEDIDKFKLVYGKKEDLIKKYNLFSSFMPSNGAEVSHNFVNQDSSAYSTVRFLLQSRKLSQIMASTWIDPKQIADSRTRLRTTIIRKIFDLYNITPPTYWLSEGLELNPIKDIEIQKRLLEFPENKEDLFAFLIQPSYIGYSAISLALLLSGQAYYRCQDEKDKWVNISESIMSTYEMVWEYALDISWDTFYAYRVDLSQTAAQQKPPFTKVTLGYPPRPDEFSLRQKDIQKWVAAKEDYCSDNNPYPFYPEEGSDEWNNQKLQVVAPPYPYLPLSTC